MGKEEKREVSTKISHHFSFFFFFLPFRIISFYNFRTFNSLLFNTVFFLHFFRRNKDGHLSSSFVIKNIFKKRLVYHYKFVFFSLYTYGSFFLQQPLTFLLLMFFFRIYGKQNFQIHEKQCYEKREKIQKSWIEYYNVTKIKWNIFVTFCQAIISFSALATNFRKIKNTFDSLFILSVPTS